MPESLQPAVRCPLDVLEQRQDRTLGQAGWGRIMLAG